MKNQGHLLYKNNPDGTVTLIPAPGTIVEPGTPVNAANLNGLEDDLESHKENKTNPHGVTKAQVGLGSVSNYEVATKAEAETGASNAKLMTPLRVKEAIDNYSRLFVKSGTVSNGGTIPKTSGFKKLYLLCIYELYWKHYII